MGRVSDEVEVNPVMDGQPQRRNDAMLALAERQHGVVSRAQLDALDLGRGAIEHRLDEGRLHPLHRGVYAVGHRVVSRQGRWMAAVLAMGPGAVLSHRSAAALWGLRTTARARVEVTVPGPRRSRPALEVHRARLAADEVTLERGIPVTTASRTLLDLAAVVGSRQMERAVPTPPRSVTSSTATHVVAARQHCEGSCPPSTPASMSYAANWSTASSLSSMTPACPGPRST